MSCGADASSLLGWGELCLQKELTEQPGGASVREGMARDSYFPVTPLHCHINQTSVTITNCLTINLKREEVGFCLWLLRCWLMIGWAIILQPGGGAAHVGRA